MVLQGNFRGGIVKVETDAPRFIDYVDHAEWYGTALNPHEGGG